MSFDLEKFLDKKIIQANDFIESPFAQEFSATELKIFEISVARCDLTDLELVKKENNKKIRFSASELAKLLNTSKSVISQEAERISKSMVTKHIHARRVHNNKEVEFVTIAIMPFARYYGGFFELEINYKLIPYFLAVDKPYTQYYIHNISPLKSAYAIKLYKLLCQYRNIKKRTFTIEELRLQFGLKPEKYFKYNDFKKNVLTLPINQINQFTDLYVVMNEIKSGRKIEKVEFIFEKKDNKLLECDYTVSNVSTPEQKSDLVIPSDLEISINTKKLLEKYKKEKGIEYVEACINYATRNSKSNLDKYLSDTLIKGWADLEIKKAKNKKANAATKVEKIKLEEDKRNQEKKQENIVKSEVEHEWNKLLDSEKQHYIAYSDFIIRKYNSKLTVFVDLENKLPLSIFAITNNKFYDRNLEGYIKNIIKISLNINNFIAN